MSTRVPIDLERVAESLADSAPGEGQGPTLDWSALERAHPELAETLAPLRALEHLAIAHRVAGREPADAPAPGAFRWGPLVVHERLGEGAFGEVFRAHDPALGRDVALKLRRATAAGPARAWLAEARRLARVSHPNVLAVLGVGEHDGRAGLWTELVLGETLETRLVREGPLPPREVALVGVDLCRALAAVHAERLVHGDVKTANVMCERGPGARHPGRIVLTDFGAGQAGPPASPATWTPLASAPELLEGGEASMATDQYALGVLLYRLLTARWPFEAKSVAELAEATARSSPPLRELRPDLPAALHDAVLRAIARSPASRHANLSAFERALAAAVGGGTPRPGSRRRAAAWTVAAVIGAALLASWLAFEMRARRAERAVASIRAPAVATPAPSRPLEASATLLRRTSAGSEPLVDGGVVGAGDRLVLEMRAPEPVWVYVLDEDVTGAAYALFPLAGLELRNPLAAGVNHRLPGTLHGRDFAWQVGEGGGGETFLVVASRRARPDVEAVERALTQASRTPRAPPGRVPREGVGARSVERGVDGLVEETPPSAIVPAAPGPVTRLAEQLAREHDPGSWVWRVRTSPAPRRRQVRAPSPERP